MLSPEHRRKLDGIVLKMSQNSESPENIQFVVDDFKKKYENQVITPAQASQVAPKEPDTFGGKVAEFGKGLVRDVTKPVIQSLAAPAQLAAYGIDKATGGNSPVEDFSFTMPFWGEISPAQTNQEAIGRGMKTVAVGAGPVSGGALYMGGDAMEQNKSATSVALNTAGGALGGKLGDLALKGVGTVLSKTGGAMQTLGAGKDALLKSAMKNYETVLGPTTKQNKRITQQITGELAEREVTATTRQELFEKAGGQVEKYGEEISEFYKALPENTKVQITGILKAIDAAKRKLFVQGEGKHIVPEVNRALFKKYQDLQIEIMSMAKGGNAPIEGIRSLRQALDRSIAKTTSTFGITGEETIITEARKGVSNILRGELAKQFPDVAAINKEFTFWSRVQKVLGDTIERTTGQSTPLGERIMTAAGGAAGIGSGGVGTGISTAVGIKYLYQLVKSAAWQTTSASVKMKLANALVEGDGVTFSKVINELLKASGYIIEKTGNLLKATPGVLKNTPRKNIPGTRDFNLKDKAKTILDEVSNKGGLSIHDVSKDYVYHTTSVNNANKIRRGGMQPSNGQYGRGIYFAPSPELTGGYGSSEGAMIRVKRSNLPKDFQEFPGEQGWTAESLPSSSVEVSFDNGKTWKTGVGGVSETLASKVPQKKSELTTKLLKDINGKAFVSKQYLLDATNRPELKQVEKDLIRDLLETEGDKINVPLFTQKVEAELLPLKVKSSKGNRSTGEGGMEGYSMSRYENVSLPDELRGNVKNYKENVYNSPVKTSAGGVHFDKDVNDGYFGHTRVEDMAPEYKVGNTTYRSKSEAKVFGDNPIEQPKTRRVIEVQSDLYQKGGLENNVEKMLPGIENVAENLPKNKAERYRILANKTQNITDAEIKERSDLFYEAKSKFGKDKAGKLAQYNNPTAHFRMVREEIKQAADDGVEKLQFPTGETAMKIEGLGQNGDNFYSSRGWTSDTPPLKPEELKVGASVVDRAKNDWIITDVLGDGKFKAVPKDVAKNYDESGDLIRNPDRIVNNLPATRAIYEETFDISGKVDTNNPIYKFYEKELGKYLKSKYNAELITDKQGVSWWQIDVKPEHKGPVEAFGKARIDTILAGAAGTSALAAGVAGVKSLQDNSLHGKTFENKKLGTTILDKKKEPLAVKESDGISKNQLNIGKGEKEKNEVIATIVAEAIGEGEEGMQYVLNNIMNRSTEKGKTMHQVVKSANAYSAYGNEMFKKVIGILNGTPVPFKDATEKMLIERATKIIKEMIESGNVEDLTGGSTHYWNPETAKKSKWMDEGEYTLKKGKHVFKKGIRYSVED